MIFPDARSICDLPHTAGARAVLECLLLSSWNIRFPCEVVRSMRTGGRMDRSNFHHRDLQREIGSAGLNDAFLRDETEPHQACGDGPNFSLMGGVNRCGRFACLERGAQPLVLAGTPGKAVPERRAIGIVPATAHGPNQSPGSGDARSIPADVTRLGHANVAPFSIW
jgi:hypothetical protein